MRGRETSQSVGEMNGSGIKFCVLSEELKYFAMNISHWPLFLFVVDRRE